MQRNFEPHGHGAELEQLRGFERFQRPGIGQLRELGRVVQLGSVEQQRLRLGVEQLFVRRGKQLRGQ
jgi:hypothetical protein